jgi:hypothetical protein
MVIVDRWNNKVFESNSIEEGWNGNLNNSTDQPCAVGMYIWRIEYKESSNNQQQVEVGEVYLYR